MRKRSLRFGFTLIELLVVIGVLAVLSSGVVALIDPADKLKAANDAKVQNDLGQYAVALQAYYLGAGNGAYPAGAVGDNISALSVLVTGGELVAQPSAPTGYTYYYNNSISPVLYFKLQSKKYAKLCDGSIEPIAQSVPYWVWCSSTNRIGMNCGNTNIPPGGSISCP